MECYLNRHKWYQQTGGILRKRTCLKCGKQEYIDEKETIKALRKLGQAGEK